MLGLVSIIVLFVPTPATASRTRLAPQVVAVGVGRTTDPLGARARCWTPPHERDAPWQPNPPARPHPPTPATSGPPRSPTSSTSRPRPCPAGPRKASYPS